MAEATIFFPRGAGRGGATQQEDVDHGKHDSIFDLDLEPAPTIDHGAECGDSHQDASEECDDGNLLTGDGCSPSCQVEQSEPVQSERVQPKPLRTFEELKQHHLEQYYYRCGDGILDFGELCDDGNVVPGDGCDGECRLE